MSYAIRALLVLLVTQFLVIICLAAEPQYQVPNAEGKSISREPSKVCGNSKFNVVGGGDILVEDCEAILKEWQATYFNISLWDWVNASNASTPFKLSAQGTCEISLMRVGGYTDDNDDLLVIGDSDLKGLINQSIELARVGDGTKLETVNGTMNCSTPNDSDNRQNGIIDWTLAKRAR
ncbi:hypothetical protein VPNG_08766 [Cytospora leucostoma]|uniref:Ecp2 effector protein-like domain-containing protein n=1 Tax=Cytospora leucostoma TaxID=1230097 RepID=A0A423VXF6_9PEZI|nr:hypothetical protein VPNG_08766 [Cytospora leucostoma]